MVHMLQETACMIGHTHLVGVSVLCPNILTRAISFAWNAAAKTMEDSAL